MARRRGHVHLSIRLLARPGGVVVRNNPPGGGNPPDAPTPCAEADLNGHHIKVFPAVQFTNMPANMPANFAQPQQTGLMIQIQPAVMNYVARPMNVVGVNGTQTADDGLRLTLAKVTDGQGGEITDRKSTRLNSSHRCISYAV